MYLKKKYIVIALLFNFSLLAQDVKENFDFYGDLRLRTEYDWHSKKTDGLFRDNRNRQRYRLRFGVNYFLNDKVQIGGRIRSGNPNNEQSPHVTFGEGSLNNLSIDKAFVKYKHNKLWLWAGKNSFPFYTQNEMFWDADVTPEGFALGFNSAHKSVNFKPVIGFFKLKSNALSTPSLWATQLNFVKTSKEIKLNFSSGIFSFKDLPNRPDGLETYHLDYTILINSLSFQFKNVPIKLGVDMFHNYESLNTVEIHVAFKNANNGYVFNFTYGNSKEKGDLKFGYYYAHIEKYAVVDYLAQDDWLRWGTSDFTRSSNYKGHEIRLIYTVSKHINLVARTYLVKAIASETIFKETANRFRLDLNVKF